MTELLLVAGEASGDQHGAELLAELRRRRPELSCFGLGGPAETCAAVVTPGWLANFEVSGQPYEVRFGETGTIARSPQI